MKIKTITLCEKHIAHRGKKQGILSQKQRKNMSQKNDFGGFCKTLKIRCLKRRKIQGTYFKISALYFKIYGLYFLQHALCVFLHGART